MDRIYLDNAATSFPKPPGVALAMARYATEIGAPARGSYAEAREAGRLVQRCRERVAELVNCRSPAHVVFTLNTSDALNLAIHGAVRQAGRRGRRAHVVTSTLDHNSILRPFNALADEGEVDQTRLEVDPATGVLDPVEVARAIRPDTLLVATLHASNVTGAVQPAAEIGRVCRERGVLFVLDAAQSAGHMAVDMEALGVDLLALAGHKGLLGPTGTGALVIRPGAERMLAPVREGGTGSRIELERQPDELPDRFEPGSHNTIGIVGLSEGVAWLLERGPAAVHAGELQLSRLLLGAFAGSLSEAGYTLLGPAWPACGRVGVFSFTHETIGPQTLAAELEARGILGRAGLHCAPLAHRGLGTTAGAGPAGPAGAGGAAGAGPAAGAMRLSVGPFSTPGHIAAAVDALGEIAHAARSRRLAGALA